MSDYSGKTWLHVSFYLIFQFLQGQETRDFSLCEQEDLIHVAVITVIRNKMLSRKPEMKSNKEKNYKREGFFFFANILEKSFMNSHSPGSLSGQMNVYSRANQEL